VCKRPINYESKILENLLKYYGEVYHYILKANNLVYNGFYAWENTVDIKHTAMYTFFDLHIVL